MHDFGPTDLPLGPVAQPLDGPFVPRLAQARQQHHVRTIVAGMFEIVRRPRAPVQHAGRARSARRVAASYRKAHLYDSFGYRESDRLLAGAVEPVLLEVGGLHVGLDDVL